MTPRKLSQLARMDAAEFRWRLRSVGQALVDRGTARLVAPRWKREKLAGLLTPLDSLQPVREALNAGRWPLAHQELSRHFVETPARFVIGAGARVPLSETIRRRFQSSAEQAAARADRILAGDYDLLGYRDLRFDTPSALVNWHIDPVHGRCAPRAFWSAIPYLEPQCGDHKIIWELNRHQHWLALGRAFWLTGRRRYRDRFVHELTSWLEDNPPLVGINWASMLELALRSLSWIWALHFFVETSHDGDAEPDATPWTVDLLLALDRQLTQIERNLSHYFSPNTHLLGEALTLYVCGCALPELSASARRQAMGRRILIAQIDRQIADDGGHHERSTHYHRYTLDFYNLALVISRVVGDPAADAFAGAVSRLGFAARLLATDHGRIPHIGDDDGGALFPIAGRAVDDVRDSLATAAALVDRPELQIGRTPEETCWLVSHPSATAPRPADAWRRTTPIASAALAETGYYISRASNGDHLVIDGGPHGFQNGGHAHADALSLTFSVRNHPLLIDPGTGCYTTDPAVRDRFRSTALHNTLTIDDRPQSLASGPFHWTHTAHSSVARWRTSHAFDYFDGRHDGYRPLSHRRCVLSLHGDLLIVADLVDGSGVHAAAAHWQIDPRWAVQISGNGARFVLGQRQPVTLTVAPGVIESFSGDHGAGLGWHSPVYGRIETGTTLRVVHYAPPPFWTVSVFGRDPRNPVAAVDLLSTRSGAAADLALRITRAQSVDSMLIADGPGSRIDDVETDAALLFFRETAARRISQVALVDGSTVRRGGLHPFDLNLGQRAAAFSDTFRVARRPETMKGLSTCAASPVS